MDLSLKGNIRHSVSLWCYDPMTLDELCIAARDIGITAIDLCGPAQWPTLQKYGLHSPMCNGAEISLTEGFNDLANHNQLISNYERMIPLVAQAGYQNLICFSGNRNGMDDGTGLENCAKGIAPLLPLAQKHNVVLCMELLNSKIDHPGYQCDHTAWGLALAEKLGSANFKLLYDIYHMQIMEGDIIRHINAFHPYIAHYHTGGVPGRNEINTSQELYYPAIMEAIVKTGFKGYVGQEFVPANPDKIASLREAISICDV